MPSCVPLHPGSYTSFVCILVFMRYNGDKSTISIELSLRLTDHYIREKTANAVAKNDHDCARRNTQKRAHQFIEGTPRARPAFVGCEEEANVVPTSCIRNWTTCIYQAVACAEEKCEKLRMRSPCARNVHLLKKQPMDE